MLRPASYKNVGEIEPLVRSMGLIAEQGWNSVDPKIHIITVIFSKNDFFEKRRK